MSFAGKIVLVAGATGVVGSGVVRGYLDAGATVIGISRSSANLESLKKTIKIGATEPFHPVVGDFDTEAAAANSREAVLGVLAGRPLDHVVSATGFVATSAAATETPLAEAKKALDDGLFNSFLVAKSFLPLVKDRAGASYTMASGGFAHMTPMPGIWLGTLKNAALNALTLGLAAETAQSPVRVNTVCIHVGVAAVGGDKNQLGWPAEKDTLALAPVFLGVAKGTQKGEVLCFTGWGDVAKYA